MRPKKPVRYQIQEITATVPLDYARPTGERIEVFGRLVAAPKNKKKDIFVFLQGGPGFECPRDPGEHEWIRTLLESHRILFLDQRGTGRSTPIGPEVAKRLGSPAAIASYLSHFRGDNIVRDAEHFRENLVKVRRWYLLGQSYGGFVSFIYLCLAPEGLKGVIATGGIPPWTAPALDAVYADLLKTLHRRNMEWYRAFPRDVDRVRRIVDILRARPYEFGDGKLTADRFRYLGLRPLGSTQGLPMMHAALDGAFVDSSQKQLAHGFARSAAFHDFEAHPIYTFLHEPIYTSGPATRWSAQRMMAAHGGFGLDAPKICLFGETILPSLFGDCEGLRPFAAAAQILAEKNDWPVLYDERKLAANRVPVECLSYRTDLYISHSLALRAAKATGATRVLVHPTWQHDSLRMHGQKVIGTMLQRLLRRKTV